LRLQVSQSHPAFRAYEAAVARVVAPKPRHEDFINALAELDAAERELDRAESLAAWLDHDGHERSAVVEAVRDAVRNVRGDLALAAVRAVEKAMTYRTGGSSR
jgi:hypothetical protein